MSAACTVPKEKFFCKFWDTKNSHNTSACIKKQKEEKERKKENKVGKTDKDVKPATSCERREQSEEKRKRDLSALKRNSSPVTLHTSSVQVQTKINFLSGTYSDSEEESYKTPLESLKTESEPEYDDNPNAPELSEDNLENDEEVKELLNRPENE